MTDQHPNAEEQVAAVLEQLRNQESTGTEALLSGPDAADAAKNPLEQAVANFQQWTRELQLQQQQKQEEEEEGAKKKQEMNPFEMVVGNIQQFFADLDKKDNQKQQPDETPAKEDTIDETPALDTTLDTIDLSDVCCEDDDDKARNLDTTFDTVDTSVDTSVDECSEDASSLSGNESLKIPLLVHDSEPLESRGIGYGQLLFGTLVLLLAVIAALIVTTPEPTKELFLDGLCAPIRPGSILSASSSSSSAPVVYHAPWWSPPLHQDAAFQVVCGSRPRTQIEWVPENIVTKKKSKNNMKSSHRLIVTVADIMVNRPNLESVQVQLDHFVLRSNEGLEERIPVTWKLA
jgi:hypothetical protein